MVNTKYIILYFAIPDVILQIRQEKDYFLL